MITWVLDDENRIDTYFLEFGFNSRSAFKSAFDKNEIFVNGQVPKRNYKLRANDVIEFHRDVDDILPYKPSFDIEVLYEDEYMLIINKPAFIAVHPAKSYTGETVVDWLLYKGYNLSKIGGEERPGIVHRLDKDTSGVLIIAKDDETHEYLKKCFQDRRITKKYFALVNNSPKEAHFIIDAAIGRSANPTKMAVVKDGRRAISIVDLSLSNSRFSLLDIEIKTGRTHQIRVHLASQGLPIVGDTTYGLKKEKIKVTRQMLHAHLTKFTHPFTKKELTVEAPLPEDFIFALQKANLQD